MAQQQSAEKPGILRRMQIFAGEVRNEMTKVSWPTQEQVKQWTVVVLVSTAILACLIAIWDLVLGVGVDYLFGLGA